ncbi:hypothetical protein BFW87_24665 [Pseudomonas fluorescens]|uniref:Uncharacterized protein n=1 Tax=Pseudomonas fluorescens TaxID=294 RepID=A0A1T2Y370_PSEFL|nr:hypothetical protein [Pseudomonas fluorescens]OPA86452.1 hypothetical protein BFW87_24665 [Pseudomonas fluorescens]
MIDKISGQRVMVCIDEKYGPFIQIIEDAEPAWLEKILQGELYIPYWVVKKAAADCSIVLQYHFGFAVDPVKLQKIIDGIECAQIKS